MIVECKQCRTKFRFDDDQMQGDGIWMRCSRCQHVFFQDSPAKIQPAADAPDATSSFEVNPEQEKAANRLSFEPAAPFAVRAQDEDVGRFLDEVMAPVKGEKAGRNQESPAEAAPDANQPYEQGLRLTDIEFPTNPEDDEASGELRESDEEMPEPPARKTSGIWKAALWSILVIVVIPAVLLFVVFPQQGERYIQIGRKFAGLSPSTENQPVAVMVKLQDVRQRMINNYVLGNIRIVEGTAINQADFSIARILVKGEMLDAYAIVLSERVSYAGNVLTDEELTNLSEEDILKRLTLPEGRNQSNERLIPNGRISFMIVFTREPPGSIKTTVMVAGAERLL